MSKVKLSTISVILMLLGKAYLLLAQETPASNEVGTTPLTVGSYANFVETTYNDPNWILAASDIILRANFCLQGWYEKALNPCYNYNRYWELGQGATTGRALFSKSRSSFSFSALSKRFQCFLLNTPEHKRHFGHLN